ncbi:MAG: hypothetical protein ABWU14_02100 [Limnospira maxima]
MRNPPKEQKSGFDPIASIAYLEGDRTYLGEPNTLWETYTRCWVPLHSTQPTTGERSHLPGGTQHAVGNIYPLLGCLGSHPNQEKGDITPKPAVNKLDGWDVEFSDRTYLGEPNTLWETYTRCWVTLHSTQPNTGER